MLMGHVLRAQDCFIARNLDLLVLAIVARWISGSRSRIFYEVLDIRGVMQRKDMFGWTFRLIERWALKQQDGLIVSSPAYVSQYFKPTQNYHGRWALLENKLFDNGRLGARPEIQRNGGQKENQHAPWVLGWFGTLRCNRTLQILETMAETMGQNVKIMIAGVPRLIGERRMQAFVDAHSNVEFWGRYKSPDDLSQMYSKVDFIWCGDTAMAGDPFDQNPKWLLLNRLYEGPYFGVPVITVEGTQNAMKARAEGLGWILEHPVGESLVTFLNNISVSEYRRKVVDLLQIPSSSFCDDGADIAKVLGQLLFNHGATGNAAR